MGEEPAREERSDGEDGAAAQEQRSILLRERRGARSGHAKGHSGVEECDAT